MAQLKPEFILLRTLGQWDSFIQIFVDQLELLISGVGDRDETLLTLFDIETGLKNCHGLLSKLIVISPKEMLVHRQNKLVMDCYKLLRGYVVQQNSTLEDKRREIERLRSQIKLLPLRNPPQREAA
ncbi:hypothetical protein HYU23_03890 [Candidatus Woesearchaeota archaeon]|nr:hypothetical protein [Candidatus Woesearchaeota archaeon]